MRSISWLLGVMVVALSACMGDDEFTVSPSDRLAFSTDTVAFDTVICNVPSSTLSFAVYNRNDKAIRLPRVFVKRGTDSPFRVNVDGAPLQGGEALDFEIPAKDSILVYVFANAPEKGSDVPVEEMDTLVFELESGVRQQVILTASGQEVNTLRGWVVNRDTVLDSPRPFHVMDSLVVSEGATLTLAKGTQLLFHSGVTLTVHGRLRVMGTLDSPVVLRGDRYDDMFKNQPYDRIPGQWGGVVFAPESYDNYLNYADIHSGDFGIRVDSCDVGKETLFMENSVVHNVKGDGLSTRMAQVYVGNSQITNAGGNCVKVRGGNVTFVHCTIARFYCFTGGGGVALDFANYDGKVRLPLTGAQFANCLITGSQSDEIMGSNNPDHEKDAYEYAFFNCLFNTVHPEKEDKRLVSCLWDDAEGEEAVKREKNFTPEFDLKSLTFSFELAKGSQAIGHADSTITMQTYPLDRLGRPRSGEGLLPDIGCYQHVEAEEN